MVHDPAKSSESKNSTSYRDLFKLNLLCDRLDLSPITIAKVVKRLRKDVGNLLGKEESDVGFDSEFSGREFDLLFTIRIPKKKFGKPPK